MERSDARSRRGGCILRPRFTSPRSAGHGTPSPPPGKIIRDERPLSATRSVLPPQQSNAERGEEFSGGSGAALPPRSSLSLQARVIEQWYGNSAGAEAGASKLEGMANPGGEGRATPGGMESRAVPCFAELPFSALEPAP